MASFANSTHSKPRSLHRADHPAFRAFVNDAMARDRYTDIYDAIAAGQAAALIAIAETIVSHI